MAEKYTDVFSSKALQIDIFGAKIYMPSGNPGRNAFLLATFVSDEISSIKLILRINRFRFRSPTTPIQF
jgi:hypothetical protein